ncbi:MAG: hypothetical protein AB1352_00265 [Patescibacteria group bacterium]
MRRKNVITWGEKALAVERAATGAALMAVALMPAVVVSLTRIGVSFVLAPQFKVLLLFVGIFVLVTAMGLWKRKGWGWVLMVVQVLSALVGSVIGTSYLAASWPEFLGRWWVAGFVGSVLIGMTALVALLVCLFQFKWYFRQEEDEDLHRGNGFLLIVAVCALVAVRIAAAAALGVSFTPVSTNNRGTRALSDAVVSAVEYCNSIKEGVSRDSCFTQIAVAAASTGDALPPNFCDSVSPENPQLKFLCIAYARQPESCLAFESIRHQVLCRSLVTGNADECAAAASREEEELCRRTVEGYIDEVRKAGEGGS